MQIIAATPQTDFAAVADLYYRTWQVAYRKLVPKAYLDSLTPATWHPEKRQQNTLLAMDGDQIVGVCSFGPARLAAYRGRGELYSLYVDPQSQHQGIGRALLQAGLTRLAAQYATYYLVVLTGNLPAISLYNSAGFHATGIKREAPTPFGNLHEEIFANTPDFK